MAGPRKSGFFSNMGQAEKQASQNAIGGVVDLFALFGGLKPFSFFDRLVIDQKGIY